MVPGASGTKRSRGAGGRTPIAIPHTFAQRDCRRTNVRLRPLAHTKPIKITCHLLQLRYSMATGVSACQIIRREAESLYTCRRGILSNKTCFEWWNRGKYIDCSGNFSRSNRNIKKDETEQRLARVLGFHAKSRNNQKLVERPLSYFAVTPLSVSSPKPEAAVARWGCQHSAAATCECENNSCVRQKRCGLHLR